MPEPTLDPLAIIEREARKVIENASAAHVAAELIRITAREAFAQADREAAARSAPVGELTEREVAEAWEATYADRGAVAPHRRVTRWPDAYSDDREFILAFARRLARPSEAALREARREGWDAARDYWQRHPRSVREPLSFVAFDAERDRRWPAPPKPTPSVTLSDGTVVRYDAARDWLTRSGDTGHAIERRSWLALLCRPADTGADFEAVKRLAAQVAPERAP